MKKSKKITNAVVDKNRIDRSKMVETDAKEILELIHQKVLKLDKMEHWLMISRIINSVFQRHYGITLAAVEDKIKRDEVG